MSGYVGPNTCGLDHIFKGSGGSPPAGVSRWSGVLTDPFDPSSSFYTVAVGDDGKLIVFTDLTGRASTRVTAGLPVGFRFGVSIVASGDTTIFNNSSSEHFYNESGDISRVIDSSGNPGGFFGEFVKVSSTQWMIISEVGSWVAD